MNRDIAKSHIREKLTLRKFASDQDKQLNQPYETSTIEVVRDADGNILSQKEVSDADDNSRS
jgi:hypothetical protein